jgi:hypothetical protein
LTQQWHLVILQCEVLKLADIPSCLGGGEYTINERYGLTTKFRSSGICFLAKCPVEVRILLSQLGFFEIKEISVSYRLVTEFVIEPDDGFSHELKRPVPDKEQAFMLELHPYYTSLNI